MAAIPVIDLELCDRDASRAIGGAARDTGFFYVTGHGVAADEIAAAFVAARELFALPADAKLAELMLRGQTRGYEPLEYQTLDRDAARDLKESFTLGAESALVPNRWPAGSEQLRGALLAYRAAACTLGAHLMRLIARSLDLPATTFDEPYRDVNPPLRLLRYPPHPKDAAANRLGAGAHTDWGGITILAQDERGGLEIQHAGGEWLLATPIPGTFVVNLGDLLMRWTNDVYRSTTHRVRNLAPERDRYSMALFYGPRHDARIACLPTCLQPGEQPKYAVCTAGEHVAERQRATYA